MSTFLTFCICEYLVLRNQWITRTVLKMLWQFTGFSALHLKLSVPICSVSTFVGLCVGLSVCLAVVCLSVCVSVGLSVCVLVGLSVYLPVCLPVCLSVGRSICLYDIFVLLRPSVFCYCTKSYFLYLVHRDAPNTHTLLFVSSESSIWLWINLKKLCSLDYDKNLSLSSPFRIIPNIQPVCINMLLIVN